MAFKGLFDAHTQRQQGFDQMGILHDNPNKTLGGKRRNVHGIAGHHAY
jgi:hypothetical protein